MSAAPPPRPPSVTIFTGFLGAGKTTLLTRVLAEAEGLRFGVLVNDLAELNVDAELVAEVSGDVLRLTNGCICCSMRGELTRALFRLLEREDLDHVVVEASGVSDPRALAEAFTELGKSGVLRLDGLVGLVDAEHFFAAREAHPELAKAQVTAADLVLVTKCDLAGEARTLEVERELRALAPSARIARATRGEVPKELLFGIERRSGDRDEAPIFGFTGAAAGAAHGFTSAVFREPRPLAWLELAPMLVNLPPGVFRVKGLMSLVERPGDRLLLQVVGRRVYVRTLAPWGARPPTTELVFVGTSFSPEPLFDELRRAAR